MMDGYAELVKHIVALEKSVSLLKTWIVDHSCGCETMQHDRLVAEIAEINRMWAQRCLGRK